MRASVLVPTYRRPEDLDRCLCALGRQERLAEEILIMVRDTDTMTRALLKEPKKREWPASFRVVTVCEAGQVAALNAGLEVASGDFLAITDDDAAPASDWLARIEAHFQNDPEVGGVGGRDRVHHGEFGVEVGASAIVGRVTWWGRTIGRHHLGIGSPREVDFFKGANMSYRREAIKKVRFDTRLRGRGAQVHNDLAFSLAVRRAGWKLIYDPDVLVDHYEAPRYDLDSRGSFHPEAQRDMVYNETLTLMTYLPPASRPVFLLIAFGVGSSPTPGMLQCVRLMARRTPHARARFRATLAGRLEAWRAYLSAGKEKT